MFAELLIMLKSLNPNVDVISYSMEILLQFSNNYCLLIIMCSQKKKYPNVIIFGHSIHSFTDATKLQIDVCD